MLVDLMKSNEKPLINFVEDDYYHTSFLVNGIEATDYGIRDGSTYVLMVENSKMVLMEVEEYIDYIKQIDVLKEKAIEVEKRWEEEEAIIYDCDDCGKEVEFGGGDDFFLEPPYYNVDYPKVVCGDCFTNYMND